MNGAEEIKGQVKKAAEEAAAKRAGAGQTGKAQRAPKEYFPFKGENGLLWREMETEGEAGETLKKWVAFGSEVRVLARTRSAEGEDHGRLLEVLDCDGQRHLWAMPSALFAGSGEAFRAELLRLGFEPVAGVRGKWREWLYEYLLTSKPEKRARCVLTIGWHGPAFVLPNETIGAGEGAEQVILQTATPLDHAYHVSGTLEEWQTHVAAPALGNSRLIIAIASAFAAPLLGLTGEEGGGFHIRGSSSTGKSTALSVAGSVWGGGGASGYVKNWRATDNALEAISGLHNDALLCLDELSQVEPKAAGAAAYMLANGKGKARSGKDGQARRALEWRLIFLSTGEIPLADKIREGGQQIAAGMEVRVIDLRADAGAGLGLFENLHGATDAAAFAQAQRAAAGRCYGTAARAFLHHVAADLDKVRLELGKLRRDFTESALPVGADGQVRRVADRFALVAAAGDLASAWGVTGWPVGASREAALRCFGDWLKERGGAGSGEETQARRALIEAIETHGAARFQKWHLNADRAVIANRMGFIKTHAEGEAALEAYQFYLFPNALKEILRGLDFRAVVKVLLGSGIVPQGPEGKPNAVFHVPNAGEKIRLYQIDLRALQGTEGQADG
jgi:putative DNA primase/helicase